MELLSTYHRSLEDHENFTSQIDESNVYRVYKTLTQNFPLQSDIVQILDRSSPENRLVYEFKGFVRI